MFISGVRFDNVTMQQAVNRVMMFAQQKKPRIVCTGNLDHLRLANSNPSFYEAYWDADLVVADGSPVVWLSKLQGDELKERVTGIDLFQNVCAAASRADLRVYLLGGLPGSAQLTKERLEREHPGIKVSVDCPSRAELETQEGLGYVVRRIKATKPHILFVAFGAPLQELWLNTMKHELEVPVSIGIGGAFEMYAGVRSRAPKWMQKVGMEWLFRLSQEPIRLFDRYVLKDLPFLFRALAKAHVGRGNKEAT